jgi:hypothetical protein
MKASFITIALFALLAPAPPEQVTVLTTFPGASGPGP